MKSDENWERSRVLKIVIKLESLQSSQNDPKPNSRIGHEKCPIYLHCTLSPKFSSVSLYDQPFCFPWFPIDSHVKLSKCHKFCKNWPIAKKSNTLDYPYGKRCAHKDWMGSHENCWRSSVLKFPAPHCPVLEKKIKVP